jgi:hypothetical protein
MQKSLSPGQTVIVDGETFTINGYCTIEVNDPHPPQGTVLGTTCSGYDKYNIIADGNGGSTNELVESNSTECGYVPPPPPPNPGTIENFGITLIDKGGVGAYRAKFNHSGDAQNFEFSRANGENLSTFSGPSRPDGSTVEAEFDVGLLEPGEVIQVRTAAGNAPDGQWFGEGSWVPATVPAP